MTNVQEIWMPFNGYEGFYEVSNYGRVKSLSIRVNTKGGVTRLRSGKIKALSKNRAGYMQVCLGKNGTQISKQVHRAVAIQFISNPQKLPEVNHKDGNKSNNYFENLEWVTSSQNQQHAINTGLNKVSYHPRGKRPIIATDENGIFIKEFVSCRQASFYFKASSHLISLKARGLAIQTGNVYYKFK